MQPLESAHRGRGTVTNFNGDFILRISEACLDDTLTVSYVGYVNGSVRRFRKRDHNNGPRDFIPIPQIIIRAQDLFLS
ncbi:MAG: hypothetical protein R2758_15465 [Bacteroidales bacterium]